MKKGLVFFVSIILIVLIFALIVLFKSKDFETTLEFTLRDAVSEDFVWDAEVNFQNRIIRAFYQSDQGTRQYTFTHLKSGKGELTVSAPSYNTVTLPITLKRGKNIIEEPIEMRGYEIAGLDYFCIFEEPQGNDILLELHPVGKDGKAVTAHPCVDIRIGCMIFEQINNGGQQRGKQLFIGTVPWTFDPSPETIFRYTARLRGELIKESQADFRVIDYLVIVPDSRKITIEEVDALMAQGEEAADPGVFFTILEKEKDRLNYYYLTNWNVKGP